MSTGTRLAAYWDWPAGAEVPDARIVVCSSGLLTAAMLHKGSPLDDGVPARAVTALSDATTGEGEAWAVVPEIPPMLTLMAQSHPPRRIIPALHITRQDDLARLPDLLAVNAERRAVVVSPEEAIDLYAPIDGMPSPGAAQN